MHFLPIENINNFRARKIEAQWLLECFEYQDFPTILKSLIQSAIDENYASYFTIKLESNNETELQRIADFINKYIGVYCAIIQKPDGYYFTSKI